MRISFVTLFPEIVEPMLGHSIMARAKNSGIVEWEFANPRDFATDKHRSVDDTSYGGGPGMVMMPTVVADAVDSLNLAPGAAIVLADAAGEPFTQAAARGLGEYQDVAFICGHYEGMDERVRTEICTHAFSVGDFVVTGGELPSLLMADAVVRLLPGVLGDPESHEDDSHSDGLLGFPLYTKPAEFRGVKVPDVLLSGDHAAIAKWRRRQQLERTKRHRPDLFCQSDLLESDLDLL
ncbi:tRNA (guanosine(37)-N1)-methyltransferase TrmD [Kamptonema cortianum]|nr:tRNA (guanosine(37)-N1)-methyltransferase TrmD [Geitlerinema splendidum]MDK3155933.1 tRNA (guanosine(37)-N1)-methyltransferase TrmD [Kamptonema cortianum]